MKKSVQTLMLAASMMLPIHAFAESANVTLSNIQSQAKLEDVRRLANRAATHSSTPNERKAAIEQIRLQALSLTPDEQQNLMDEVTIQVMNTSMASTDRAEDRKDSVATAVILLSLGVAVAVMTPKMGSVSRLAAGFAMGSGISAIYDLYVANGITSDSEANIRELRTAMSELRNELRLKNKADQLK